jgi:hypothetical protein
MRRDSKVRLSGTSLVHLDTRMFNNLFEAFHSKCCIPSISMDGKDSLLKQTGILSVGTFVSNLSRDVVMFSFQIFTVLVAWKYSTLDIYFL